MGIKIVNGSCLVEMTCDICSKSERFAINDAEDLLFFVSMLDEDNPGWDVFYTRESNVSDLVRHVVCGSRHEGA